ncbi:MULTISPECIES: TonB-dependent receptor domain-containing protein [Alkalimonas]|uniref:TonB-dependent receptor n=1 Tax=Alkalimonas mucilaginosa TaxID=3057676 RepID=A0ABU7JFW0_9GAMM|nr:TonB-dependent receptor [Alkalimonas sp. MEB004]MEE2024574.1 TonB-dependent receptor [Alkalimonas sp. MEB004]
MYTHKLSKAVRLAIALGATATAVSVPAVAVEVEQSADVERIQVTGSRIRRTDMETSSPIQITSSEEIKLSGFTRVEDLMNSLPQIEAAQTAFIANGASGTATLDLRGLGATRTLVLVNGRRLQPGGLSTQSADINQIPAALVERVEVLTGGGSATYGADAVAGVVNFVMKDDFEGIEIVAGASGYQHKNRNKYLQGLMDNAGFEYPTGSTGIDGRTYNIDLTMGGGFDGGRGHATVYATWRKVEELRQGARDYSSCAFNNAGTACGGSATSPIPNFFISPYRELTEGAGPEPDYDHEVFWMQTANGFAPYADNLYNYAPINHFMRPDERYTLGAFINYELSDRFRPYAEVSYMHNRTTAQIAESGTFFRGFAFDITSPAFTEAQREQLAAEFGPDVTQVWAEIGKRNSEGGPRQDILEHSSYRLVIGTEGALNDNWMYDISLQYGSTSSSSVYMNDYYTPKFADALGAIGSNCTGSCIPDYLVFQPGGVTPESAALLGGTGIRAGITTQTIVNGFVTGDLGVTVPSHSYPIAAVLGFENREVSFENNSDEVFAQGQLAGQGGPIPSLKGSYNVKEIFGELSIPLLEDMPAVRDLTLDLGARYSHYNTSGGESTYKVGIDWTPVDNWKVRASYNRAVRAPNVSELFESTSIGLWSGADPCAGTSPTLSQEQCALTGMDASQYGNAGTESPASQYNGLFGGNVNLKPEIADTYTFGIVANPIEGFNFSIDYFDIVIDEVIGSVNPELQITQCALTGIAAFCDNIVRDNTGGLWRGDAGYVIAPDINLASRHWRGIDVSSNYQTDLLGGTFTAKLIGSYSLKKEYEPLPGLDSAIYDCSGKISTACFPQPKWRHTMTLSYSTGDFWTAQAKWRYFGGVDYVGSVDQIIGSGIASQSYFDVNATFELTDYAALLIGMNNIFDKEPPMVGATLAQNANTVAGYYDTLGRYLHASITLRF